MDEHNIKEENMKVVYASRTGNVQSFIDKTGLEDTLLIENGKEKVQENFVLVTYTDGYGELPEEVATFLENNNDKLVGVAASGDSGYGEAFCLAADVVSDTYGVPILHKFENDGTNDDVETFLKALAQL